MNLDTKPTDLPVTSEPTFAIVEPDRDVILIVTGRHELVLTFAQAADLAAVIRNLLVAWGPR